MAEAMNWHYREVKVSYDVKDPKTAWSFLIYYPNNKVIDLN